jgi:hypothetical protein
VCVCVCVCVCVLGGGGVLMGVLQVLIPFLYDKKLLLTPVTATSHQSQHQTCSS